MKTKLLKRTDDVQDLLRRVKTVYSNKYYNLFMKSIKWTGIDEQAQDFLMRRLYDQGTIACFKLKNLDEPGFANYTSMGWNMYDFPANVQLINKYNLGFIPSRILTNGKDVVLGWVQPNHKPVKMIVDYYIDRMAQVEMVINTNLQTAKMPFMLGVTPEDTDKVKDIVARILNNEIAVFSDMEDLNAVKSFVFDSPYIIDKLYSYKTSLENELLTFLGLDNALSDDTKDRLILDQVNANNAVINSHRQAMLSCLEDFTKQIKEVLNFTITATPAYQMAVSIHEDGEKKDNGGDEDDK